MHATKYECKILKVNSTAVVALVVATVAAAVVATVAVAVLTVVATVNAIVADVAGWLKSPNLGAQISSQN